MSLFSIYIKMFFIALLGLSLIFISCDDNVTPENSTTFTARIIDNSGTGVSNATIEALGVPNRNLIEKTVSDEDGNFTLSKLPTNIENVLLRISHIDFNTYEESLVNIKNTTKGGSLPITLHNQDSCCGMIIIYARDKESEDALKEVQVKLSKGNSILRKNYTNSEGKLVFDNICKGEYWLRLAKDGYKVIEEDFKIEGCDTLTMTFDMETKSESKDTCCNSKVKIYIKDKSTSELINGATVKLWQSGHLKSSKVTEHGYVIFEDLCKGKWGVSIHHDHYQVSEFNFEIDCGSEKEFVHYLKSQSTTDTCNTAKIKLFIKDYSSGNAISGALVKIYSEETLISEGESNSNGYYIKEELKAPATYKIVITKSGYKSKTFEIKFKECNTISETIKMEGESDEQDTCCNSKVKIYVKDKSTSELINGATVKLWQSGHLKSSKVTEHGYVIFEDLCKGKWGVSIHHDHYQVSEFNFEIDCGSEKEFVHYLKSQSTTDTCNTAKIKLFIKDYSSGNAISGALVKIYSEETLISEGESNSNGYYIKEALKAPATYKIVITKNGYKSKTFEMKFKECTVISETIKLETD